MNLLRDRQRTSVVMQQFNSCRHMTIVDKQDLGNPISSRLSISRPLVQSNSVVLTGIDCTYHHYHVIILSKGIGNVMVSWVSSGYKSALLSKRTLKVHILKYCLNSFPLYNCPIGANSQLSEDVEEVGLYKVIVQI